MIYVSTSTIRYNKNLMNVLDRYHKIGIKHVELGAVHFYIRDYSWLFDFKQKTNMNFIVHGFFPPTKTPFFLNIGSQNKVFLKKSLVVAKKGISMCANLGSSLYSLHGGMLYDYGPNLTPLSKRYRPEDVFSTMCDSLKELCDFAGAYNIKIAVENMVNRESMLLVESKEFRNLFEQVKNKNLGALVDIGHLNMAFTDKSLQARFIRDIASRVFEFHIHKNNGNCDQHLPIEQTDIFDIVPRGILKKVYLTLEGQNNWSEDDIKRTASLIGDLFF
ncbi:MAG: sugar phosphate isomerase/epimerase family protein [Candidatus Woesearchaeota archaeon]